jgi:hypothetical protein
MGNGLSAMLCCDDEENVIPRLFEILKAKNFWQRYVVGIQG